jgi:hypothetical protein
VNIWLSGTLQDHKQIFDGDRFPIPVEWVPYAPTPQSPGLLEDILHVF